MATWNFSGYNNGRGAAVTFTYTSSFNAAANQTTVTITNYTSVFNTGGASSICSLTGTLTVKAADNTGSSGTLDVSQSKNGSSPTISTDVSKTITVSHGTGTSKQIVLSFSGDINANYYHSYPDESTTVTVASATARSLSISAGEGASVTVNRTSSPWAATGAITGGTVYDGDVLTISFSVSTGYNLSTHTVNGSSFANGGTHTVSGNVDIVATATRISYTLTLTTDGHCVLTVTRNGSALASGDTIYYGDSLNISFSAQPGYEVKSAILNGSEITSPYIHRVTGNVEIVIITELLSSAWIYTNGAFKRYFINIFTQGKWRKRREKIFPGGGSESVVVFAADFSGLAPSADQFYSWEGRIYDNAIYDALQNIQCTDGVAVLTSVYDSANSRWKKQMMCTTGLFEADNFTCTFKAKFSGLAGSWQNVITYGTGTYWTNNIYADGVKWPAGGKIDAFEQAGGYADVPNTMHTPTVHYGSGTNSGYPNTHQSRTGGTVEFTTDQWHDFKFSLNSGYVKVWIDNVLVGESDFSDCLVSNNYMADYAPFLKPQAFYIDGSCASGAGAIDTSNVYKLEVTDFKIIQDAYVECTGLEIYPQMWAQDTELIFPVGSELYLDRVYTPANTSNKACTWESSNPAVATVVQGFVKVLSVGTTTITATCGNATAQYVLTAAEGASVPCAKITTDSDDGIIVSGNDSVTISPYLYPSFTTDVTSWGTSDSGIVTVDNGVVSGVAAGKAYITVSCGAVSTVIPVTVTESVKPYISYDFTPLFAYINTVKSSENESVTIANAGTLGSVADLTMSAGTQNYYNDETYEPNGVVAAYGTTSPALDISLKGNVFAFVYKGINYADRVYTRKDYASKILLNGTNANVMPSVAGVVNAYGDYYVRYGAATEHRFSANGVETNIVVYSDGANSQLYINGEKIVDKGSIGYVAQTLSTLVLNNIDEQIKGLDIYIGQTFAEDELIAMSTPM